MPAMKQASSATPTISRSWKPAKSSTEGVVRAWRREGKAARRGYQLTIAKCVYKKLPTFAPKTLFLGKRDRACGLLIVNGFGPALFAGQQPRPSLHKKAQLVLRHGKFGLSTMLAN
jgi:hypothetical protein